MQIGNYKLSNPLVLAPMAGVTDRPFRQICRQYGAGLAVGEMLSSNPKLWATEKSKFRMDHTGDTGIRSVQIAGCDPDLMAAAAQHNVSTGAQIIDINMGCPAKKVNKKLAGSALLQDPVLVEKILQAVVNAVDVPVSLKIRTGWDPENRNGVQIAKIAEQAGIQALTVHGRTRACLFKGEAEFETIQQIKQSISIPVIANGDICSPERAKQVLNLTGADAIMIGRGAQGRPWLFNQINHYLEHGEVPERPSIREIGDLVIRHIDAMHQFYGNEKGYRMARKHVAWYLKELNAMDGYRKEFNAIVDATEQLDSLNLFFENLVNNN
ncbi:tRNA dihydrouridine synthase DusB [Catenovulum maritimum]|uniref:tRNA-dihydrouridine synthase B n=1 Tax=Catenovulum maritimum TaxID=1513271 RepID=A0A0J8GRY9_9ALTE|nr:tRNA dihydrouridine synthase DusB [Catenovulum maritimum]KMT65560.1 tRNA-dihydrouridine synthase B [Catenovulum maritimum]